MNLYRLSRIMVVVFLALIAGCASRAERLSREHEELTRKIYALRKEQKAIVNLQLAVKQCIKAHNQFEVKREKLLKIREANDDKGLPLGPDYDEDLEMEEALRHLERNENKIADQIRILKKKRARVATEQMNAQ